MGRISVLVWVSLFATPCLAADCGRIISASGSVEVLRTPTKTTVEANPPRAAFPIGANDIIRCDDIIATRERSSAVLLIPRGKLAIGANTKITIAKYANEEKPDANLIDLFFGQLRSLINKKKSTPEASKFQVRTPTAVTGVRGTDFFVSYDEKTKVTQQATLDGEVEVTRVAKSAAEEVAAPTIVSAGQQVTVTEATTAIETAPMNDAVKTKIRATSILVQKDADFVSMGAVTKPAAKPDTSASADDVVASYRAPRWIFSIGPSDGEVNHASGNFDGSKMHGHSLMVEHQKPLEKRSLLMNVNYIEIEDENSNMANIRNRLKILSFEGGLRIWHDHKWSPFIKAGLGYLRNDVEIMGTKNEWEYLSLVGVAGVEGIFKPFTWTTAGLYGAVDGRLNQTLFVLGKDNPSNFEDESLNAFIVTLRAGISLEF